MEKLFSLVLFVTALLSTPGITDPRFDWSTEGAHVIVVEGTYIPDHNFFKIDADAGSQCPAGTWLKWPGQGPDTLAQQKNVEAVYSMLLAAKLSNSRVNVFGRDQDCTVNFIHLTGQ
jgi:hypothetical protein